MTPAAGGRPRSEQAHRAILEATDALLREEGYGGLTIEKVAARAGVGKRTIYRWWPSKGALVAEAFGEAVRSRDPEIDTGSVRDDLVGFLGRLFVDSSRPGKKVALRSMMVEAQLDPDFAELFTEFISSRREILHEMFLRAVRRGEISADADLKLAIDALFGTYWYRLLVGHLPLDASVAEEMVDSLLKGLTPR
jgi:AcrR family transcriptional regulator